MKRSDGMKLGADAADFTDYVVEHDLASLAFNRYGFLRILKYQLYLPISHDNMTIVAHEYLAWFGKTKGVHPRTSLCKRGHTEAL
jgi:hypothetical protein